MSSIIRTIAICIIPNQSRNAMIIIVQLFLFVGVNSIGQNCNPPVLTIPSEKFPTNYFHNCSAITGVRNWTISEFHFSSKYEKTEPSLGWMDIFREFSVDHQQTGCLRVVFNYSVVPDAAHVFVASYNFAFWCNAAIEIRIMTIISPPLSRSLLTILTENDTFETLLNMDCSLLQYLRFQILVSSEIRIENNMKTAFAIFKDSIPRVRHPSPCDCSKLLKLKKLMLECEQNHFNYKGINLPAQEDKQIVAPHYSKHQIIYLNLLLPVFSIAMIFLIAIIFIIINTCTMCCLKMKNNKIEGI